jgi:hypothetical protein
MHIFYFGPLLPIGNNIKQAYKYIYLGPSSWDKEDGVARNTRPGNASLAQMHVVTPRSIAYVAAMVCRALPYVAGLSLTFVYTDSVRSLIR